MMIVAGEASGDMHAAALVAELRRRHPELTFFGCGGRELARAGCELLVDASEIAIVGLFEVVRHLPGIYSRFRLLVDVMRRRRPRALILVDFPDFNLRLACRAARLGTPVIYFISPQLWAWRPGRVKTIRRCVRRMICIFPFEQDFYRIHGVEVDYVGHPLVDSVRARQSSAEFHQRHGLDPAVPIVALLPGSRRREVAFHLPTMLEAAAVMQQRRALQFVVPTAATLDPADLRAQIPPVQRESVLVVAGETYDAVAHARLAIVSSGTATVETALLGTPMVVVYRLSEWTFRLGRHLVKSPHYAMVNLIGGRQIVPELIQDQFEPHAVVNWTFRLLDDTPEREEMRTALAGVRERLGSSGAISRAAAAIERELQM